MSTASRVRKSSPVKQGPMKATIPMASLFRHSTGLRKSPTLSPTSAWRTRTSPDSSPSGQRSPGSVTYKAKSKTLSANDSGIVGPGSVIRRTASLDAIYLKGQWPRDSFYLHSGLLQVDKATQTEDPSTFLKSHRLSTDQSSTLPDDKLEKLFRQRLARTSKDCNSNSNRERLAVYHHQTSPGSGIDNGVSSQIPLYSILSPTAKASPMNIPIKPIVKPPMRNSIEGLNQEIERLVLKGGFQTSASSSVERGDLDKYHQITPEGHRAPLADLLRSTRSVNTQTPAASDVASSCQSSGPPSRDSPSPLIPGLLDDGSQNSSPEHEPSRFGTSPHINRFLAREPPDGCERVALRSAPGLDVGPTLKPCVTFQLRPSLGSAFHPLQPTLYAHLEPQDAVNEIKPNYSSTLYSLQTVSDETVEIDELTEAAAMPIVPEQDII